MEKRKNTFDLISNNDDIKNIINKMKLNTKIYSRLISSLQLLGNFEGKTEVEVYDIIDNDEEKSIRLWCSDSSDNLFIFYAESTDRKKLLKILKENNEQKLEYDISLAKKYEINSKNIEFTRNGKLSDVKFGRLITNECDFYSLFMGGDLGYQLQGDFDSIISSQLIKKINMLDENPNLSEYIRICEEALAESECNFSQMKISVFKNFERIGHFVIGNKVSQKNNNIKQKTINNKL